MGEKGKMAGFLVMTGTSSARTLRARLGTLYVNLTAVGSYGRICNQGHVVKGWYQEDNVTKELRLSRQGKKEARTEVKRESLVLCLYFKGT